MPYGINYITSATSDSSRIDDSWKITDTNTTDNSFYTNDVCTTDTRRVPSLGYIVSPAHTNPYIEVNSNGTRTLHIPCCDGSEILKEIYSEPYMPKRKREYDNPELSLDDLLSA